LFIGKEMTASSEKEFGAISAKNPGQFGGFATIQDLEKVQYYRVVTKSAENHNFADFHF